MSLKRVSWVRRYQGQCRALRPLGHQGYRLRNYKKDPPLCSGYSTLETNPEVPKPPCLLLVFVGLGEKHMGSFAQPSIFELVLSCLFVLAGLRVLKFSCVLDVLPKDKTVVATHAPILV